MLPPPPFPPHNLPNMPAPNTPNQLATSRSWNGGTVLPPPDPRLATPRVPPYPSFTAAGAGPTQRQIDSETLQLLQLKQQLLQQGT